MPKKLLASLALASAFSGLAAPLAMAAPSVPAPQLAQPVVQDASGWINDAIQVPQDDAFVTYQVTHAKKTGAWTLTALVKAGAPVAPSAGWLLQGETPEGSLYVYAPALDEAPAPLQVEGANQYLTPALPKVKDYRGTVNDRVLLPKRDAYASYTVKVDREAGTWTATATPRGAADAIVPSDAKSPWTPQADGTATAQGTFQATRTPAVLPTPPAVEEDEEKKSAPGEKAPVKAEVKGVSITPKTLAKAAAPAQSTTAVKAAPEAKVQLPKIATRPATAGKVAATPKPVTCADFASQAEAMVAFKKGATNLDSDGDGKPCGNLPATSANPSTPPAATTPTPATGTSKGDTVTKKQTTTVTPSTTKSTTTVTTTDTVTCEDFNYQEDAQVQMNRGTAGLDPDGNGVACENLPKRNTTTISSGEVDATVNPSLLAGGIGVIGVGALSLLRRTRRFF